MFNINIKNLISFGFGLLTVFALMIISIPQNAKADNCNSVNYNGWYATTCQYNYTNTNNNINPIPSITSISPNSAKINSNTNITVSGYGFVPSSTVRLNGYDRPTTFVNSNILRVQFNSSDLNSVRDYSIAVLNPAPGGGYSNTILLRTINNTTSNYTSNTSNTNYSNTSTTNNNNETTTQSTNTNNEKDTQASDLAANAIFGTNAFMPSSLFQWFFFAILILLAVILWRKIFVGDNYKSTPLKHA